MKNKDERPEAWLSRRYPEGIGLGDVIREYVGYMVNTVPGDEECNIRLSELTALMNFMHHMSVTPIFNTEHRKITEKKQYGGGRNG